MENKKTILSSWIYSLSDYKQMFGLTEDDLSKKIVDYPGSMSSFNAEMHSLGHKVVSGDAIYKNDAAAIRALAKQTYAADDQALHQFSNRLNQHDDPAIEAILTAWMKSKQQFLADYAVGKQEQRYQAIQLPHFPFEDHEFSLALCSDLIFHDHLQNPEEAEAAIGELCRVAEEVRIFPLLDEDGEISATLGPMMLYLQQLNFGLEVKQVPFDLIKGGNAMLRIWAKECVVES